jgi:hypothetical protein
MTWYWSYRSLPELAGLPSERQRSLWLEARSQAGRRGELRVFSFILIVDLLVLVVFGGAVRIITVAVGCATLIIVEQRTLHLARPHLRAILGTHCRKCGYSLQGNVSGVCPECGWPIGSMRWRAQ